MKKAVVKISALLLAAPLLLSACARTDSNPAPSNPATAAVTAEPEPTLSAPPATPLASEPATAAVTAEPEPTPAPPSTTEPAPEPAEAIFPRSFSFGSGAGGWSTELEVAEDGSFTGVHHDSDMGVTGENYPNGTVYTCHFHGQFSQPEQVDDLTYTMRLEWIEAEEVEGEETFADGVRYVGSYPYGLDGADEIQIYLPGSKRQDLPESFVSWTWAWDPWDTEDELSQNGEDELTRYGLYNVAGEQGFVEVGA